MMNYNFIVHLLLLITFLNTAPLTFASQPEPIFKNKKHNSARAKTTTEIQYYLQDPQVMSMVGQLKTPVYLNHNRPILEDSDLKITRPVLVSTEGNFIFPTQTPDFDAASVFATVRTTMNMYRSDLSELGQHYTENKRLKAVTQYWQSGSYGKLLLTPEAGPGQNAYYQRIDTLRELKFFTFAPEGSPPIHSCRSSDIVAHEAGHAILDILKPQYYDSGSLETSSYHESFGDQTALFWTLSHPYLCRLILKNTKGNLHQSDSNFLSAVGEQFGHGIGLQNGLRNADEDLHLEDAEREPHALGVVYTGAIYDTLVDVYEEASRKSTDLNDKAKKLFDVAEHLRQMTLYSLVNLNKPNPGFSDLSFSLTNTFKERAQSHTVGKLDRLDWAGVLEQQFSRRGINVTENGSCNITAPPHKFYGICGVHHK